MRLSSCFGLWAWICWTGSDAAAAARYLGAAEANLNRFGSRWDYPLTVFVAQLRGELAASLGAERYAQEEVAGARADREELVGSIAASP